MIHIAIADDHQLVIDGLQRIIQEHPEEMQVTCTANSGEGLLTVLAQRPVDIVILDISMPGMKAGATLKAIKKDYPNIKVLVITMHGTSDHIKMMIAHGADGYLLKNQSGKELIGALRSLSAGKSYFPEEIKQIVFDAQFPGDDTEDTLLAPLTTREEDVLRLIAEGAAAKQVADRLFISTKTVESHKRNLMKKTGSHNVQGLVRFAMINGYYETN